MSRSNDRGRPIIPMKGSITDFGSFVRNFVHLLVMRLFSVNWKSMFEAKVLFSWDDHTTLRSTGTSWLDGLRGVAAMQVFFFHFFGRYTTWARTYWSSPEDHYIHQLPIFRPIWASGSSAVCVFFVISGYAVTVKSLSLLRRQNIDEMYRSLCSSLIRRGFRLYIPLFLLAIPTLVLIRWVDMVRDGFLYSPEYKETLSGQIVHLFNQTDDHINPFMYPEYNPTALRYGYVPPAWTIPMEYHGSLACYLLVLVVSRVQLFRLRALIVGAMALYAIHRGCWWISNFLVGMLIADYVLEQQSRADMTQGHRSKSIRYVHNIGFTGLFFCGWYLAGVCPSYMPFDFSPKPKPGYEFLYKLYPSHTAVRISDLTRWWWYWSGNFTFFSISQLAWLRAIFETHLCQWLGKLSFSLYLVHATVLGALSTPLRNVLKIFSDNQVFLCFAEFIILTPFIFIVAGVVERYMDRSGIRFARWFDEYITQERSVKQEQISLSSQDFAMDERPA